MPRVALTLNDVSRGGLVVPAETNGDATNNHTVTNDGKVFVLVRNSGAGARTVTFVTPGTVDAQAVADRAVSMTAGQSRYFGPFPPTDYGDPLSIDVDNAELKLTAFHLA